MECITENGKGWLLFECPFAPYFHKDGLDRNPDFWIKTEPNGYSGFHCFACKSRGNLGSLVRQLEYRRQESYGDLAIMAVVWEAPENYGKFEDVATDDYEPVPINAALYAGMYPLAYEVDYARNYLKKRGISEKTAQILELVYAPDEARIMFPVKNHKGELYGFTGRTVLEERNFPYPKFPKVRDYAGLPKEKTILGEQLWKPGRPILLVEGLFALAKMIELGVHEEYNVGAVMGSRITKYQRDILAYYNQPVYLLFDGDLAGVQGIFGRWDNLKGDFEGGGAIDMLREHVPVLVPEYPPGIEDPDNLVDKASVLLMLASSKLF